jgi:hypothetical protein
MRLNSTHSILSLTCLQVLKNIGFHPIPLGVWGWWREKGEIVGNQAHFLCFVKSSIDLLVVAV